MSTVPATSDAIVGPIMAATQPASAPVVSIHSIASLITIRLNRGNFLLWKTQAVPALHAAHLFGYVDGSIVAPPPTITEGTGDAARQAANPEFLRWYQQDQLVLIALLGSMSEDLVGQMTQLTTSAAVWASLHAMFSSQNRARLMQIRFQLSNTRKKDLTAAEYFNRMKALADSMAAIGVPLKEDEVLGYMLAGLGPEYEPLVVSLTTRADSVSLDSFYAYLVGAELRLEQQASMGDIHSSANSVARHSDGNRGAHGGHPGQGGQGGGQGGGRFGQQPQQRRNGNGQQRRNGPKCQVCSKYGHDALRCRQRFNHAFQPEDNRDRGARSGNAAQAGSYSVDTNWYMDSGATDHLTSDLDRLHMNERYSGKDTVQVANGQGLHISHVGRSSLTGSSKPLHLNHVLYVPRLSKNLLSVHKLAYDNDAFVEFHPFYFCVKDRATRRVLLRGDCHDGLYPVPSSTSSMLAAIRHGLSSVKVSTDRWHERLGHPSKSVVDLVLRTNKIACAPSSESSICDACQRAKVHQLPFHRSSHVTHSPLELIHSDVWGPAVTSVGGFKYYVSFLDDFSRFTWIYLLKRKSDVEPAFYSFQKHVELSNFFYFSSLTSFL
jgi:histone deacetylase 1/2